MHDYARQREKALIIWEGAIRLIPDSVQVESALWNNQREMHEVKEELIEYTNPQVAAYKKIRDVIIVEEIPVSGAGKVLKRELREKFDG